MDIKFKNIFFILICVFSFNLAFAKNESISSEKKQKSSVAIKAKQKKKKQSKKSRKNKSEEQRFLKNAVNADKSKIILKIDNYVKNLSSDIRSTDFDISFKFLNSDYGYNLLQNTQKIVENINNICSESMSGLDDEISILQEAFDVNLQDLFGDFDKLYKMFSYLHAKDVINAEKTASEISFPVFNNIAFVLILNAYAQKNDLLNAFRIYETLQLDDDFDQQEIAENLLLACLRNKEFLLAEKIVDTIDDEDDKDDFLCLIAKYHSWVNNTRSVLRLIDKIGFSYYKNIARLYLLDSYARQNNIKEFQKLAFSIDDRDFQTGAFFMLSLYENNLEKAENNRPLDDDVTEIILKNFVEILVSNNHVKEAEDLFYYLADEDIKEDLNLYFVSSYLKNNDVLNAKRIANGIKDDLFNKFSALKLISIYSKNPVNFASN